MRRLYLAVWSAVLVPILCGAAARAADDEKKADASAPTIAVFRLTGAVTEEPAEETFSFGSTKAVSLKDLVTRMKQAAEDEAVKAVVLLHEEGAIGSAQREEIRQVMAKLRAAGKDVYTHADSISMSEYVLLSGASQISVVPTGDLWITGLYGELPYLRGLLNILGVKPDFLTCGEYKSAAEVFLREGPSKQADEMQNWLLDSLYKTYVKLIAQGRGVDPAKVRAWIDNGPYSAEKAKAAGIIDAVEHRQAFEAKLKSKYGQKVVFDKKYGKKKPPKLDFSSPFAVFKIMGELMGEGQKKKKDKSAIGIVYVDGPIVLGSGVDAFGSKMARSTEIRKALEEAAQDDSIKAVVLRVDSPGGSAVASEIILDATKRVKAKKPFVVSMGDVAGSGGYYVACGSDVIFADESTITGSIGVVSGKFATNPMWKKIGVTFKEYKRGANAGMLSSADVFSPAEKEKMQAWMDEIYGVFKGHVTEIRGNRLKKPIDELAGGRVYTGQQALDLGLVDKIGTLQDAITYLADKTHLTDYDVRIVPEPKNFLERLVEEISGEKDEPKGLDLKAHAAIIDGQPSLFGLALPHLQHLDPQRVQAIKMALLRLQLMQQEGAVLMMPEIILRN
ncbi:MAG TPA: signal peptide peptidase SppA [Gemmataceae bacterium]|nr:signal peptide peptidase SppA [Gemmataceae bacterium]